MRIVLLLLFSSLLAGQTVRLRSSEVKTAFHEGCNSYRRGKPILSKHIDLGAFKPRIQVGWISDYGLAMMAGEYSCRHGEAANDASFSQLPLNGRIHAIVLVSSRHGSSLNGFGKGDGDLVLEFKDGSLGLSLESQGDVNDSGKIEWEFIDKLYKEKNLDLDARELPFHNRVLGTDGRIPVSIFRFTYEAKPGWIDKQVRLVLTNRDGRTDRSDYFKFEIRPRHVSDPVSSVEPNVAVSPKK